MGFLVRLRAIWSSVRKGFSGAGDTLGSALTTLFGGWRPVRGGTSEILRAYGTSPWLHAASKRIAIETATKYWPELYDRPQGHPLRQQIYDHPLLDLLLDPMPGRLPASTVWLLFWLYRELAGESLLYLERNAAGYPVGLVPIAPTWVSKTPTRAEPWYLIYAGGSQFQISERDVLSVTDPDPLDPFGRGLSTAKALANEIDISQYASDYLATSFMNGATPAAIVSLEGADKTAVAALKADWRAQFQGPRSGHRAFFTGGSGKISVETVASSNRDLQLVELRAHERDTIVQTYGIPPELFGILENSNRATVDAAYYLFSMAVLSPRMRLLSEAIQMRLAPEFARLGRVYAWHKNPVPEDRDFLRTLIATAPMAFRIGDVRRLGGVSPSERDEEWLTQASVVAGPTNGPPGKSMPLSDVRAALLSAGCRASDLDRCLARLDAPQSAL